MLYTVKTKTLKDFIQNQFNVSLSLGDDSIVKACKPDGFANFVFSNKDNTKCYWVRFNEMDFFYSYFNLNEDSENEISPVNDISKVWLQHVLNNEGAEFLDSYPSITISRGIKISMETQELLNNETANNLIDNKIKKCIKDLESVARTREDELDNIVIDFENKLLNL